MEQARFRHGALCGRVVQNSEHHQYDKGEPEQKQPPILHAEEKQHYAGEHEERLRMRLQAEHERGEDNAGDVPGDERRHCNIIPEPMQPVNQQRPHRKRGSESHGKPEVRELEEEVADDAGGRVDRCRVGNQIRDLLTAD